MELKKADGVSAHDAMQTRTELGPLIDRFIESAAKLGMELRVVSGRTGLDIETTLEAPGGHRFVLYIAPQSLAGGIHRYTLILTPDLAPDGYHRPFRVKRVGSFKSVADRAAADLSFEWARIFEDYRDRLRAAAVLEANGFVATGGGRYALESGYIQMRADGLLDVQFWQGMSVQRTLRALGMENVHLEDEDAA